MPKQKVNYNNTEIYKLIHKDDIDNENIYIGSTTNFRQRKCRHKSDCNNEKTKIYNLKVYQNIRLNGGWEEWNMLLVEKYPCIDKKESNVRERYWIDFYKSQLNIVIPSRSRTEWKFDNKEEIKKKESKQNKKYYQKNKEKYKEYNQNHKEKIKEYQKQYTINQKNKEKNH